MCAVKLIQSPEVGGQQSRTTASTGGTSSTTLSFRFSAKYTDAETGLLNYGRRYLQPPTGRWLSRDPIEERDTQCLHAFVGNNPLSFVDARGLARLQYSYVSIYITNPDKQGDSIWTDYDEVQKLMEKAEDLLWKLGVNAWSTANVEWSATLVNTGRIFNTTYDLVNIDKGDWKAISKAARKRHGNADDVVVFIPGDIRGHIRALGAHDHEQHVIAISRKHLLPANLSRERQISAIAHEILHHFLQSKGFVHDAEGIMYKDTGAPDHDKLGCKTLAVLRELGVRNADLDLDYVIRKQR